MIHLLFAAAVGLFVLSLPIRMTTLGASLRRAAGFCFVLALVPSMVIGLFFGRTWSAPSLHPVVLVLGGVALIVAAYLALRIRAAMSKGARDHTPRISEKTPIDRAKRREQDFFAYIADQRGPTEDDR
ncbi:MAG: hypothetical protein ABI779_15165 [Acidobacteriota bacterium]